MEWSIWLILAVLAALAGLGKLMGVKVPVSKKGAWVLLIGGALATAYLMGYIGPIGAPIQVPPAAVPTAAPAGVYFEAEGSETDANLGYDSALQIFSMSFYENWKGDIVVSPTALGTEITSVTLSITVFNVTPTTDNVAAVATITSRVPTYLNENGTTMSPVDKDTTLNQWKIAMTPTGGSARNEKQSMSVPAGGSKAMSIVITLDKRGALLMDNYDSYDTVFTVSGVAKPFILRIIKTGVDHTA